MNFPENINFPNEEKEILKYWHKIDAFQTSLKQSQHKKKYSFYDGPPFATGLPHYGHLLAGTIKDIVTRYAHQTGHHVDRRFGWDCHGVPIEYEIDKQLGVTGPHDVLAMGIGEYNRQCRSIVDKYSGEWEEIVTRLGRWIDFRNDYKTMYPWFMESVWYVFKQIYEKGMVYRGVKVMPFSTACSTPLSNFEAKQNFKEVDDPAVVVGFKLVGEERELLAWTTTPWTLPSNLAVCVNGGFEYVCVRELSTGRRYVMLEGRLGAVFKKEKGKGSAGECGWEIVERFSGRSLEGKRYEPLFGYFAHLGDETGAFRVVCDDYVTADSGTGIVHQAPYFGEDDYRVCLSYGIIRKETESVMVCPVNECGRFTSEVTDFAGRYVKEADKDIIAMLKAKGRLVAHGSERHSYPFCWRSDTPLLYKAVPSWFIRVEEVSEALLKSNDNTYWVPDFVKENRFGNWLREARDWAVSRNRFWGTPMPLWVSEDGEEVVCVGSIEELHRLSGVLVRDLHREFLDDIVIPSKANKGVLRRVPEVFDCWFEAGSMPYAQVHFPFSTTLPQLLEIFPADFIAEGIDQTRGWFYTLTVIGTLLFGKSPFKNLIVNGIVLAEDGQKMSKRLRNYPDPSLILDKFGADALRLFLINSPVVRAQNLKFQEVGVRDILKDVFLPWYNAFKFLFLSSIMPYERKRNNNKPVLFKPSVAPKTDNVMDLWIISFTQSLIKYFRQQMKEYRLDTVIPRLVKYIDHLTNYYVRMNRRRLRGETVKSDEDWLAAIQTLFFVLYQITIMLSPFVPFITEFFYQKLKQRLDCSGETELRIGIDEHNRPESVHYLMIPSSNESLIKPDIEESVALMQVVVEMGRKIRDQKTLPLKSPLMEVVVVTQDLSRIERIRDVESYVLEELNVRQLTISNNKKKYNVELKAELNHKVLGMKLKKDYQRVLVASKTLSTEQLEEFQKTSKIDMLGHLLTTDDLEVIVTVNNSQQSSQSTTNATHSDSAYESISNSDGIIVLLDCQQNEELLRESVAREIINRIQRRRKELGLVPEDPVRVLCWSESPLVQSVLCSHRDMINKVVLQPLEVLAEVPAEGAAGSSCSLLSDRDGADCELLKEAGLRLWLRHDHERLSGANRQCTAVEGHCSGAAVVVVVLGEERVVFQEMEDLRDWDSFLRHVRVAFGWTRFGQQPVVLYDREEGRVVRSLGELGGGRTLVVKAH